MSDPTSTKIQSETEALLSRSILYQALSFFLRRPDPTLDFSAIKENARIFQDAADALSPDGPSNLRKMLDDLLLEFAKTAPPEWMNQYEKFLGYTVNGIAPAYELEYGEEHTHRQPQQLADIAAFHHAFGLQLSSQSHERVDHASVECEFMHFLLYKELLAREEGKKEQAEICWEASRRFLSEHLGYWFPAFVLRLSKHSEGLMKKVADFAFEFVVQDCFLLGIKPGPKDLPIRSIQERAETGCVSCQFARPFT